mmetsp:Transcript_98858/g.250909  ORF Transcript_98858/g.250909 Transcript_98858/m.250909 type:complete len:386 (-) Transcript_98858:226-1383(-)
MSRVCKALRSSRSLVASCTKAPPPEGRSSRLRASRSDRNCASSSVARLSSACKNWLVENDSFTCSWSLSGLAAGCPAGGREGSVSWPSKSPMTSLNPPIVSKSWSCKSCFSKLVFLNIRSESSFCIMERFNSLMRRSRTMQESSRPPSSGAPPTPGPGTSCWTGNSCRKIAAEDMCFFAWKQRIVSARRSRAERLCAESWKVLLSLITSVNLVVSSGCNITRGNSEPYSATTSRPPLPGKFATRTLSAETRMFSSWLPLFEPRRLSSDWHCIAENFASPAPRALSRLRRVPESSSKGPISPEATPKKPSSASAGWASTVMSVPTSSAEIWYMLEVTPGISTMTSATLLFQRHLRGTGRPPGARSAAATSTPDWKYPPPSSRNVKW